MELKGFDKMLLIHVSAFINQLCICPRNLCRSSHAYSFMRVYTLIHFFFVCGLRDFRKNEAHDSLNLEHH